MYISIGTTRLVDEGDTTTEFTTTKDLKVFSTFEAMNLKEDLLRGIYAYGMFFYSTFSYSYFLYRI